MSPHGDGTSVNVRTDGSPANAAQKFYFEVLKEGITSAITSASEALKATGCIASFEVLTGEAARLRGEARDGVPSAPGKN